MKTQELDQLAQKLAKDYTTRESLIGKGGIFDTLFQKTLQAALDGELTMHLGYERHAKSSTPNSRNG